VLRRYAISLMFAALVLPAGARTRPHYGGTLHVAVEGDAWQRPDGLARRLVFDGLTTLDANGIARPALAIEERSENGDHRWQFRLRPSVHFQDGSPLTSVSVVTSLMAACASNCPWTSVHAVGSSVIFNGDSPMPNLPQLLASDDYRIVLSGLKSGSTAGGIGTGAFQVAGFSNGVLTLTANENCWQGRPFLDAVEIHVQRAVRDQWLDLSVGRADLVEVPAEQLRQARERRLTVAVSPPVTLLALQIPDFGVLSNLNLRAAIALALDRSVLSNVIFQKQGEVTASLLPQSLTGYSFLFSADQDLKKAHELRGGLSTPQLTLGAEGAGAMQLAAQRIALNLREAGFNVQLAQSSQRADLVIRRLPIEGGDAAAAFESALRRTGFAAPVAEQTPAALYNAERQFLDRKTLIPLLDLPRAWAVAGRVRDLRLGQDGLPDLAAVSLEDAK
jgi:peptide/nickel transport system substrate-binding protein